MISQAQIVQELWQCLEERLIYATGEQFEPGSEGQAGSEVEAGLPLIQKLKNCLEMAEQLVEENDRRVEVVIDSYESITHLLDTLLVMKEIIQTNDRRLLVKSFLCFEQHLVALVNNLHEYPVGETSRQRKNHFVQRHLGIMEQVASVEEGEEEVANNQWKCEQGFQNQETSKDESSWSMDRKRVLWNVEEELSHTRRVIQKMQEDFNSRAKRYQRSLTTIKHQMSDERELHYCVVEQLEVQIVRLSQERDRDRIFLSHLQRTSPPPSFSSFPALHLPRNYTSSTMLSQLNFDDS